MGRITRKEDAKGYIIIKKYKKTAYKTSAYGTYVKKGKDYTF